MKVPKPNFILHSLVNTRGLPQLSVEDTENTLKNAEECRRLPVSPPVNPTATVSTRVHDHDQGIKPCSQPLCFKTLFFKDDVLGSAQCIRHNFQVTPKVLPRLVNLSFSQPTSPRTPSCVRTAPQFRIATPVHPFGRSRYSDQSVLNTPCVVGALQELQMAHDTGLPDVLALVEDDLTGLGQLERQILRNTDMELTDNNVVDYLLDVAHDHFVSAPSVTEDDHCCQQNQQTFNNYLCNLQQTSSEVRHPSELNVRRKRRRSEKRMTSEEALAVRRQRRSRSARAQARQADKESPRRQTYDESTEEPYHSSLPVTQSPALSTMVQTAVEIVQHSRQVVNTTLRPDNRQVCSSPPLLSFSRIEQEVLPQAGGQGQTDMMVCFPLASLQSSLQAAQDGRAEEQQANGQRRVDSSSRTLSEMTAGFRRSKRNRRRTSTFKIVW